MAAKHSPRPAQVRSRQRGVMLIEALIAILIFSIGILGIIGLQASAVKQSTDARYRTEAAQLADQLISQMWVGNRTAANLQTTYNSCGSACVGYYSWFGRVKQVLPGVSDDESADTMPFVDVSDEGIVTVKLKWRQPGDDPDEFHQYIVQAQIGQ